MTNDLNLFLCLLEQFIEHFSALTTLLYCLMPECEVVKASDAIIDKININTTNVNKMKKRF